MLQVYIYIADRWVIDDITRPKDGASFELITAGSALVGEGGNKQGTGLVPPNHLFLDGISHGIKHPAIGDPPLMETPIFMMCD